jgi:integrase/recombinase XerD
LFDRHGNRKYLNAAERLRFYEAAIALPDPHDRAFCLTLFYTGCRISEALHLTRGDVDQADGALIFRTLKQREKERFRSVPVADELLKLLASLEGNDPSGKLPRQRYISKVEVRAGSGAVRFLRKSAGGRFPRESCGRSSL